MQSVFSYEPDYVAHLFDLLWNEKEINKRALHSPSYISSVDVDDENSCELWVFMVSSIWPNISSQASSLFGKDSEQAILLEGR